MGIFKPLLGLLQLLQTAANWEVCYEELKDIAIPQTQWTFNAAQSVSNPRYNIPSTVPHFVAAARTVSDVKRTLQCAAENGVPVSARGGGHNYAGYSQVNSYANGGIQLSLKEHMRTATVVDYAGPAMRVQAGAIFGDLYKLLNDSYPQYVMAGGMCPSVGIAGFHLGGGLGILSREFGMGVDNVLEINMVTSKGERKVVANSHTNKDLFWALRGGGGPSFGVVTDFVIRLHPSFPKYSYGETCQGSTPDEVRASLNRLGRFTSTSDFPDWLTVDWRLTKVQNTTQTGSCFLLYSLRGRAETLAYLTSLYQRSMTELDVMCATTGPDHHLPNSVRQRHGMNPFSYDFLEEFDNYYALDLANARHKGYEDVSTYPGVTKSYILPPLSPALVDTIVQQYELMPEDSSQSSCSVQGLALGGRSSRVPVTATAFPFRERLIYVSDASCSMFVPDAKATESWVTRYVRAVEPWSVGAYLNFPWTDIPDYERNYYGPNLRRLRQVRRRWNPWPETPLSFPQEIRLELPHEAEKEEVENRADRDGGSGVHVRSHLKTKNKSFKGRRGRP